MPESVKNPDNFTCYLVLGLVDSRDKRAHYRLFKSLPGDRARKRSRVEGSGTRGVEITNCGTTAAKTKLHPGAADLSRSRGSYSGMKNETCPLIRRIIKGYCRLIKSGTYGSGINSQTTMQVKPYRRRWPVGKDPPSPRRFSRL